MTNIITLPNQTLRDSIMQKKMELFEVKHMAEIEQAFKIQCKIELKNYKSWYESYKNETDAMELFYGQLHGIVLRRRAQDAVQAYWIIRHDFRKVFDRYVAAHKPYQPSKIRQKAT